MIRTLRTKIALRTLRTIIINKPFFDTSSFNSEEYFPKKSSLAFKQFPITSDEELESENIYKLEKHFMITLHDFKRCSLCIILINY